MNDALPQSDHDLLIRMDENVRNLRTDFTVLNGDITKRLDDHEARMRRLEKYVWWAIGALTVMQFIVAIVKN